LEVRWSEILYAEIHVQLTVDGRNPAPVDRQFIPLFILQKVLYIPGGAGFFPSTVSHRYTASVDEYNDMQFPPNSVHVDESLPLQHNMIGFDFRIQKSLKISIKAIYF